MKKIIFTGGGSAGHVNPNIAIINSLDKTEWDIHYIGTKQGIEKTLITPLNIPYHTITTGKLRRYFSWQNFIDPFKLFFGIIKSFFILFKIKPKLVFSKGGFVSLPVVIGAWLNHIPVILHESDLSPGLANKLSFPFAKKILLTFDATKKFFKNKNKLVVVGTPIRENLFTGKKAKGLALAGLSDQKPILLIICGSLGSKVINENFREALSDLNQTFSIIHICGKGNVDTTLQSNTDYKQYEYLNEELADIFACADIVISRSGANSLYELLALKKPHLLIPLSKKASRGDQIDNAQHFEKLGLSLVLPEEAMTPNTLIEKIDFLFKNKGLFEEKLDAFNPPNSLALIKEEIETMRK